MSRNKLAAVTAIILVLLTLSVFPGSAVGQAPTPGGKQGGTEIAPEILFQSKYGALFSFRGKVKDKRAAEEQLDHQIALRTASVGIAPLGYGYDLNAYYQVPYGNAYVNARFNSHLDMDLPAGFATRVTVTYGSSRTAWLGSSPQYNSTKVKLEDRWTWHAITGVSISASGGGIAVSGNSAYWSGGDRDTWYLNHVYGGITGSSMTLYKFSETATGSHFFQSTHTWVSASAYNYMWV